MRAESLAALQAILADPARAVQLPADQAAALAADLATAQLALAPRLLAEAPPAADRRVAQADHLLTPNETAERLGVTKRWLYRHAKDLSFTRRLSRKTLRFSEAGLDRYLAGKLR